MFHGRNTQKSLYRVMVSHRSRTPGLSRHPRSIRGTGVPVRFRAIRFDQNKSSESFWKMQIVSKGTSVAINIRAKPISHNGIALDLKSRPFGASRFDSGCGRIWNRTFDVRVFRSEQILKDYCRPEDE